MITRPIRKTFTITTSHERLGVTGELDMTLTPKVLFKIALLIAGCVLVYFFWKIAIAVMAIVVMAALCPNRTSAEKRKYKRERFNKIIDNWYYN